MKLVSECDVLKIDKRNTKRRYLVTDGICFRCGAIINYSYQKRCILCCGSNEFLVGEQSTVLRDLLELDIEQLRTFCELRGISGSGSRTKLTLDLFVRIFPKLTKVDNRINELFIRKIIYRNRRRFWYIANIESAIYDIKRNRCRVSIRLVDEKDMVGYKYIM